MLNYETVALTLEKIQTAEAQIDVLSAAIEALTVKPDGYDGLTQNEIDLLKVNKNKISCIKEVRSRTSIRLKEAKDRVEAWMKKHLGFTYFDQPTYQ